MKHSGVDRKKYFKVILLGILFVIAGALFTFNSNRQSHRLVFSQQKENLLELAKSTDKNLENIISRVQNQIYYITTDVDFKKAEQEYINESLTYNLWNILRYNSLCDTDLIASIVVTVGDKAVMVSKESYMGEYTFYDSLGNYRLRLCKAPDGKYYMAFAFKGGYDQISYYALMDLEELYMQITDEELGDLNKIILYNDKLSFIITNSGNRVRASRIIDYLYEGNESLGNYIKSKCEKKEPSADALQFVSGLGVKEKKYVAVYPVAVSENRLFTLAILTDYARVISPIKSINYSLIISILIFTVGIALLLFGFSQMKEDHEQADKTLVELQEKNKAMKALLRQTRELEHVQRLELLGTMTSGISHEFNNLLTPIMGYSIMSLEMLPEGSDELSENIIEIYNASKKAKDIVKRISELSKKNSSDSITIIDIDTLCGKVLSMLNPAKPENVEVKTNYSTYGYKTKANETQMTQVLMNIIINGFHAMSEKGGTLTVSTSISVNSMISISVKDTGTGIPADVISHIFDPFFTTKEAGKGTGLGLAIVKNIIDELNGKIEIHSQEGKGTEFIVKLRIYDERLDENKPETSEKDQ